MITASDLFNDSSDSSPSSASSASSGEDGDRDQSDLSLRPIVARGLKSRELAEFLGHPGPIDEAIANAAEYSTNLPPLTDIELVRAALDFDLDQKVPKELEAMYSIFKKLYTRRSTRQDSSASMQASQNAEDEELALHRRAASATYAAVMWHSPRRQLRLNL